MVLVPKLSQPAKKPTVASKLSLLHAQAVFARAMGVIRKLNGSMAVSASKNIK
jgi:hypothetical protein